ncbi:MAG: TIGR03085 family metal-binding protein [Propionibacteriaceae bacterium]
MTFAKTERAALCQTLRKVGPDASTLCQGWDAHDLACHLWLRENDPLAASGMFVKPLAQVTTSRMGDIRTRWSFEDLVEQLAKGPLPRSLFALPGVDEAANTIEYFVHHEDLRRAEQPTAAPRNLGIEVETMLWRRLRLMGRMLYRHAGVGVVLIDTGDTSLGTIKARSGEPAVYLAGSPSELILHAYGRRNAADIDISGDLDAITQLGIADLSV